MKQKLVFLIFGLLICMPTHVMSQCMYDEDFQWTRSAECLPKNVWSPFYLKAYFDPQISDMDTVSGNQKNYKFSLY